MTFPTAGVVVHAPGVRSGPGHLFPSPGALVPEGARLSPLHGVLSHESCPLPRSPPRP